MDNGWMDLPRQTPGYRDGVKEFIKFAFSNSEKRNKILCPCKKFANCSWKEASIESEHLICNGFMKEYKKIWRYHGEASSSSAHQTAQFGSHVERLGEPADMFEMLEDVAHGFDQLGDGDDNGGGLGGGKSE